MTQLIDIAARVEWPDHSAEQQARSHACGMGALEGLAEWISGVQGEYPPREISRARLIVVGGDHGIVAAGVSAQPAGATYAALARLRANEGPLAGLAELSGAGVVVVDAATDDERPSDRIRRGSGRIDTEDALSTNELYAAVEAGVALADNEIDSGTDLLAVGAIGMGASTSAAAVASVLTNTEPAKTVGRGSGIDDDTWMRKATAVRDARRRGWQHRGSPQELLAAVGGADLALLSGLLLQAAARRTPALLDGLVVSTAAIVAAAAQPRAARWWQAASLTPEPAHQVALTRLGLVPILNLGIARGDGTGALLALPLLRAAIAAHRIR